MIYLIWTVVLVTTAILYLRSVYSRFSKHGVKHFTPIPLIGDLGPTLLRLEHITNDIENTYKAFPGERFVGKYQFISAVVMVRDLDLAKKVLIKDFDHFVDHKVPFDGKSEPLFGRNLFCLKEQEWRDMRSTLSPAFTSSKIRLMIPLMVEVGEQMVKALEKKMDASGVGYIDIEGKDLTTHFANDVIASCVFGLKVDSYSNEDNVFYKMGKRITTFKFKQFLIFLAHVCLPKTVLHRINFTLFPESTMSFFKNLTLDMITDRENRGIYRPDMIHLLMEAKKGTLNHEIKGTTDSGAGYAAVEESEVGKKIVDKVLWSDNDIVAQSVLFFAAGFETISTTMAFAMHELAVNPDVQEKLYEEIKEIDTKNGGKFDFTSIQQMTYLDMIISEVLRLWPPAPALDRMCTKDYNLGKPNHETEKDYIIRKEERLLIPVWGYHRNPEYFPDPLRFDPERFSEENKQKIKPFTYMPFGAGPRNCIGCRFALCEVKVMIYQLILNMQLSPTPTTLKQAVLSKEYNLKIEGGHWVRMKLRN